MKLLIHLFLLAGLSPGTILPSFITDRLIAPVPAKTRTADKTEKVHAPERKAPEKGSDSSKSASLVLEVPSTYSAIRPTAFQFSKGDFRARIIPRDCTATKFVSPLNSDVVFAPGLSLAGAFLTEFCDSHQLVFTAAQTRAHAPPSVN